MENPDPIAQMNAIIDAMTVEGELVARIVADEIVEKLRAVNPRLLDDWLNARATETLASHIRNRLNSKRSAARSGKTRSVFAAAAAEFAQTKDASAFALFDSLVVVNAEGLRRRFGDMKREDCLFVASSYAKIRRESELYERFHRKLAEKLGDQMIREVYSEQQCRDMLSSFGIEP